MGLRGFLALARRWWRITALYVIVGVVGSLIFSLLTTPVYVASTTLVVSQNATAVDATDYNSLLTDEQLANTYSQLLRSHPLMQEVVSALGLRLSAQELAKKVKTEVLANTQLVTLSVEDSSQARAVTIANEIVKRFSSEITAKRTDQFAVAERSLQRQLEKAQSEMNATHEQIIQLGDSADEADSNQKTQLQNALAVQTASYDGLLKSYRDARQLEGRRSANSLVAAEAQAGSTPLRPRPLLDMVLAAIVAVVLSVGAALFAERLDDSLKSPEDVSAAVGLTTLGLVSRVDDREALNPLANQANTKSSLAESFRILRTNLEFTQLSHSSRTLLVASSQAGEGKSTVAANMAAALAQSGKRVILVDANLSHPCLHEIFGQANGRGLTMALLGERGLAGDHLIESGVEGLLLMPSGPLPPNSAELLQSRRMVELISELRSQADLVIFDSPAQAGAADAALLAGLCDAVLLVVKAGTTRSGALRAAKEQFSQAGVRIIGVLLNNIPTGRNSNQYYYDGYGGPQAPAKRKNTFKSIFTPASRQEWSPQADQNRALEHIQEGRTATSEGGTFGARLKHLSGLSLLYVIADILSRGSAILLVPLYTRFMAPSDYGILALASVISSFLVMALSFGGTSVVQRFYHQFTDAKERAQFLGTFWIFLIAVPGMVLAGTFVFGGAIFGAVFESLPLHPYIELILGISYLNIAFGTVLPSLFRAREQGMRYLALSLGTMALTIAFTLYLVVFRGLGAAGALGAQCAALAIMSVVSSIALLRELSPGWRGRNIGKANIAKGLKYGLPLIPHFAAHWTLSISDRAILERFVGLSSVGLYSLAYQFGTVLQMLLTSVNQALTPAFSRAARDKREFGMLGRLATYYYLAVAVLGLCIAMMAKDVIALLTPPAYHSASALVPYIALGIVAMGFYFIPMNALSMTAGKTTVIPFITLAAGATNVILNLILVPRMGPLAAAIDTAISYTLLAVLTIIYTRRVVALKYEAPRILRIGIASLGLYGAHLIMTTEHPLLNLLVSLLLVGCMPLLLWLLGFWTTSEKVQLARLLRLPTTPFRTIIPES